MFAQPSSTPTILTAKRPCENTWRASTMRGLGKHFDRQSVYQPTHVRDSSQRRNERTCGRAWPSAEGRRSSYEGALSCLNFYNFTLGVVSLLLARGTHCLSRHGAAVVNDLICCKFLYAALMKK